MLRMLFIIIRARFQPQLLRQCLDYAIKDTVDALLVAAIAVPDGDEIGVEACGKGHAAKIVA